MKKIIAVILTALLVFSLAACGNRTEPEKTEETKAPEATEPAATEAPDTPVDGGWGESQSPVVGAEIKAMFDKLNGTLAGAQYEPVAYLESQVVAGTNHLVLCKETATVPDAVTTYALVTVYEDLQGNVEITDVQTSDADAPEPYDPEYPISGGWAEPETPEVTAEAKAAVEKAAESLDGIALEPAALLATQIVAGTNYEVLCKATPKNGSPSYGILVIYQDLEGNVEITDTYDFGTEEESLEDEGEEAEISEADE